MSTASDISENANLSSTRRLVLSKMADLPGIYIKSQQKNEPELKLNDKVMLLEELLSKSPEKFLERYHSLLDMADLCELMDCNAVPSASPCSVYVQLIQQRSALANEKRTKNRRYEALRRLTKKGTYFCDWEMRKRDPLLFEALVGRYLTEEEGRDMYNEAASMGLIDNEQNNFSGMLLDLMSNKRTMQVKDHLLTLHKTEELNFESESEEETEMGEGGEPLAPSVNDIEKQIQRNEFLGIMQERFLDGSDCEFFDYCQVDNDQSYDPIDLMSRDAEDKYFDEEEPN